MSNSINPEQLTEDQVFDMSDEELEATVQAIRTNSETNIEETSNNDDSSDLSVKNNETLEQPNDIKDSEEVDKDLIEDGTEIEEELESDEDTLDEEPTEDEEQPEEDEDKSKEDEKTQIDDPSEKNLDDFLGQKSVVKANGKEFEFSNKEKLEAFDRLYPQAMDYTKKTQAIKPWRKTIDAIQEAGLKHEDINLAIDVLKGDKEAIAKVLSQTGIDTLDLVDIDSSSYKPNDYGRDEDTLAVKDVIESISSDREYETTSRILSKEWDETSFNKMTKNPTLIQALHTDVKSGVYDKIQIIADKIKVLSPDKTKSDLDYYIEAANQYDLEQVRSENSKKEADKLRKQRELETAKTEEVNRVKAKQAKTKATKQVASKRKAAATAKSSAGANKAIDYLDDSDEAFEEWYKKVLDNQ